MPPVVALMNCMRNGTVPVLFRGLFPNLWFFAGFSLYFARRINEAAMGGTGDIIFSEGEA